MIYTINECESTLNELYRFSEDILYLGPPINDDRLEVFEILIGFKLPFDFKYIFTRHNGISLFGTQIFGIDSFLRGSSIDKVYQIEHFESSYDMPKEFVPFSPDGRGNYYCLNLAKMKNNLCPVIFWQFDIKYNSIDEIEECNESFIDWIKEVMIEWTLEDYNYDGTKK